MSVNPHSNKQASSDDHPKLAFKVKQVQQCSSQKHLGLLLENKLDFDNYLDEKINKCYKIIVIISKCSLPFCLISEIIPPR